MRFLSLVGVVAAVSIFAIVEPAAADTLEASPTTIMLGADGRAGVVNVVNRGAESITVQIEAFDWRQMGGGDQLQPTRVLQVSPPMTHLAPGEKQIVRVRATVRDGGRSEQAFRLVISELPHPAATDGDGVHFLMQFKIPVFVAATESTPRQLSWNASAVGHDLILRVRNDGAKHVKLADLHILTGAGQEIAVGTDSFNYILTGASHEWTIRAADVTADAKLRIKGLVASDGAEFDSAVAGR